MSKPKDVPDIVVGRLPIYLRALNYLLDEGHTITASKDLAQRLGISSAQIRKDLSHFGEFGKQGMGYDIAHLRDQLRRILNADRVWNIALIGAGDLGHAIAHYAGWEGKGFRMVCVFDNNPQKIGRNLGNFEICDISSLSDRVQAMDVKIAIVAVPAQAAQAVVDLLVASGIKAILNYAPITVKVPSDVQVQYIDPVVHLQRMTFYL
ncbi:MAG: redox-sensing transcriptional repressor Rex [Anaerolineae bacterium]|jgi:redox-sensing transcriptional repressor